jgi:hypothetical protein
MRSRMAFADRLLGKGHVELLLPGLYAAAVMLCPHSYTHTTCAVHTHDMCMPHAHPRAAHLAAIRITCDQLLEGKLQELSL